MSNPLNQYAKVNTTNYTYDPNGNLTNDGAYSYTYDCENRLLRAKRNSDSVNVGIYRYDSLGRRAYRTAGGSTIRYYYSGDNLIAEYNTSGTLQRKYIYGPGIDEPICMVSGSNKYYYHYDGLGSVVALSYGTTGTIAEKYSYDAYGKVTIRMPNDTILTSSQYMNRFMFTGREYDNETGNYYYRARYYSPKLGRFLQTDPIGYYDSMNLYQYCLNNPVNYIDPRGLAKGTWNNFVEKVGGCWTVGPYDAYQCSSKGKYGKAAYQFGDKMANKYGKGDKGKADVANAARHAYWQGRLTQQFGSKAAKKIGDLHERGDEGSTDSQKDQINNEIGRGLGENSNTPGDLEDAVEDALKKGKLDVDDNDPRNNNKPPEPPYNVDQEPKKPPKKSDN